MFPDESLHRAAAYDLTYLTITVFLFSLCWTHSQCGSYIRCTALFGWVLWCGSLHWRGGAFPLFPLIITPIPSRHYSSPLPRHSDHMISPYTPFYDLPVPSRDPVDGLPSREGDITVLL